MIIACPECQTKYNLPEEKIASGQVKVKCKNCAHVFQVAADGSIIDPNKPAQTPPSDDFGFGDAGGTSSKADDEFDFGDTAGGATDQDDFGFKDEAASAALGDNDDLGFNDKAAAAPSAKSDSLDDDFDFASDFADSAAPEKSDDWGDDAASKNESLDSLFEEDQPATPAKLQTAPAPDELEDSAFAFDDQEKQQDEVFYDEDFKSDDFEEQVKSQVEDDSAQAAAPDDSDTLAAETQRLDSDDDLITTLEQLSKTAEKKKVPIVPIAGGFLGVVSAFFAFLFFAPATARHLPGIGEFTLKLHETLNTSYHQQKILEENWQASKALIDKWIPHSVEQGLVGLNTLLAAAPDRQAAQLLAGQGAFFVEAIAQRKAAPRPAAAKKHPAAAAYFNALDGQPIAVATDADSRVAAAWAAAKSGDIESALLALTTITNAPLPVGFLAALAAARIYEDINEWAKQEQVLLAAGRAVAANPWLQLWLAQNYTKQKAPSAKVIETLKKAEAVVSQLDPRDQELFYETGARAALGDKIVAIAAGYVDAGIAAVPKSAVLLTLKAKLQMLATKWADANLTIEQARAIDAELPEARIVHAQAKSKIGKIDEGTALLAETATRHPRNLDVQLAYIDMLMQQEKYSIAEAAFEKARLHNPDAAALVKVGADIALRQGDVAKAQRRLSEYQAANSNDTGVMLQLAEINISLKRFDEAERQLRDLTAARPEFLVAHLSLADILIRRNKFKDAESVLQTALTLDTQNARTFALLGKVYLEQGQLKDASDALTEALKLAPSLWPVHLYIGQLRLKEERPQEALISFEKSVDMSNGDVQALIWLANGYEALGRPGKALEQYDLILQKEPENAEALRRAAQGYVAVEQWAKAMDYLARWKVVEPKNPQPYAAIGRGMIFSGDTAGAIKVLNEAALKFPKDAAIVSELGWAYLKNGDKVKAGEHLRKAASLDPADGKTQYRLGFYYKEVNKSEDATRAFQKALRVGGLTDEEKYEAQDAIRALQIK